MILLIAYGNPLRQDDGAGLVLAEKLEQAWQSLGREVRRVAVHQLTPELAVEVVQPDIEAVVFVDARVADEPSADPAVEVVPLPPAVLAAPVVGHHLDPIVVRAYAGVLTDEPLPPFWLITVPGTAFGHGQGLSRRAQEAIERALQAAPGALAAILSP